MTGRELIRFVDSLTESETRQLRQVCGWRLAADPETWRDLSDHVTGRHLLTGPTRSTRRTSQQAQSRVTTMAALTALVAENEVLQ